jgi:hypothetical protein
MTRLMASAIGHLHGDLGRPLSISSCVTCIFIVCGFLVGLAELIANTGVCVPLHGVQQVKLAISDSPELLELERGEFDGYLFTHSFVNSGAGRRH